MSTTAKIVAILLVLAIGPAMYVFGRANSLTRALDKIDVGDSTEAVVSKMGQPQADVRTGLYLHGESEYHYTCWPLPGLWVVSFKDGKVLEKDRVESP
jgi:hypothetical protein